MNTERGAERVDATSTGGNANGAIIPETGELPNLPDGTPDGVFATAVELRNALERIATGKVRQDGSRDYRDMTRHQMMTLARSAVKASQAGIGDPARRATWVRDLRNHDARARQIFDQIREGARLDAATVTAIKSARTPYLDEGTIDSLHATHLKTIAILLDALQGREDDLRAVNRALAGEKRKTRNLSDDELENVRDLLDAHDPKRTMRRATEKMKDERDEWRRRAVVAETRAARAEDILVGVADATAEYATPEPDDGR